MDEDRENEIVIMDRKEYNKAVKGKLDNENFMNCRKILLQSAKNERKGIIGHLPTVRMSNPTLSRVKFFPEIGSLENKMGELIDATDSPTQKLTKWLVIKLSRGSLESKHGVKGRKNKEMKC